MPGPLSSPMITGSMAAAGSILSLTATTPLAGRFTSWRSSQSRRCGSRAPASWDSGTHPADSALRSLSGVRVRTNRSGSRPIFSSTRPATRCGRPGLRRSMQPHSFSAWSIERLGSTHSTILCRQPDSTRPSTWTRRQLQRWETGSGSRPLSSSVFGDREPKTSRGSSFGPSTSTLPSRRARRIVVSELATGRHPVTPVGLSLTSM